MIDVRLVILLVLSLVSLALATATLVWVVLRYRSILRSVVEAHYNMARESGKFPNGETDEIFLHHSSGALTRDRPVNESYMTFRVKHDVSGMARLHYKPQ